MHTHWLEKLFGTRYYFAPDEGGGSGGGGEGGNSGGDGGGNSGGGSSGGDGGGAGGGERTLTQADVDRIVSQRVNETKTATERQVAESLGVSIDEAKRIIAEAKEQEDAQKTEAQRAREAADAEKAAAAEEKKTAASDRHAAKVERALLRAGVTDEDDEKLDKRLTRLSRLIDVEVGADEAAIKAAVDALKVEEPALFGTPAGEGGGDNGEPKGVKPPKAPGSDPKGSPPPPKQSEDAFSRGAERAKGYASPRTYPILESTGQKI